MSDTCLLNEVPGQVAGMEWSSDQDLRLLRVDIWRDDERFDDTHVRDVLLERTARSFLVACHDELVTSFLQPFTETKLERVSACHPR